MSACGCVCRCHTDEGKPIWPGPCAGCCEPGHSCACGRALALLFPEDVGLVPDPALKEGESHGEG